MRLKLQLPAKAGQFRISECEATRLLTLSANDFQTFLKPNKYVNCRKISQRRPLHTLCSMEQPWM